MENELRKTMRPTGLEDKTVEELQSMLDKSDQTGYYRGYPSSLIALEINRRESRVEDNPRDQVGNTKKKSKARVKSGMTPSEFQQMRQIDGLMKLRMGKSWGRRR